MLSSKPIITNIFTILIFVYKYLVRLFNLERKVVDASNNNLELHNSKYTVHPVPGPVSTSVEATASRSDGTRSQKLMLLSLARLISALPSIRGTR